MAETMDHARYARQILLPGFGQAAQEKLFQSSVLVIGAGGLGCPALQYLAAAGVGSIGIIDFDTVSISNLHRQILYTQQDLGKPKATIAARRLEQLNPDIRIEAYVKRLDPQSCLQLFDRYDLILDGSDNFATRYMINDACVLLKKPLVYGAVSQYSGQVALLNVPNEHGQWSPNYRHLFPEPPPPGQVQNCAEAGVIGVLPGIIGTMQAAEAIKWLGGLPTNLAGKLLSYDLRNHQTALFNLPENMAMPASMPANREAFLQMDYLWLCDGVRASDADEITLNDLPHANQTYTWIDLREDHEQPRLRPQQYLHQIPMAKFEQERASWVDQPLLLLCQSGKRSLMVLQELKKAFPQVKAYSLKGGVMDIPPEFLIPKT